MTSATANRCYVAVPAALADLPACHPRAWLIEPFDPDAEPQDLLPSSAEVEALRLELQQEEEDQRVVASKIQAVMPVLGSDWGDKREAMGDVWIVRGRKGLLWFPGEEGWAAKMMGVGEGLVWKRRQRVYGGDGYPWGGVSEVFKRLSE